MKYNILLYLSMWLTYNCFDQKKITRKFRNTIIFRSFFKPLLQIKLYEKYQGILSETNKRFKFKDCYVIA